MVAVDFFEAPRWHPTRSRDPAGLLFGVRILANRARRCERVDVLLTLRALETGRSLLASSREELQRRSSLMVGRSARSPRNVALFVALAELGRLGGASRYLARLDLLAQGMCRARRVLEVRVPGLTCSPKGAAPTRGACQICGQSLVCRVVRCPRCDSPHHRECWEYLGGCAIYACGGPASEARLNRPAPALRPGDGPRVRSRRE